MKKFLYSNITKAIAILLLIFYFTLCVYTVTDNVVFFNNEVNVIYNFESTFSSSHHIKHLLSAAEATVDGAYYTYYKGENSKEIQKEKSFNEHLQKNLDSIWCDDKIDYYVSINDSVFTNCSAESGDDFTKNEFYSKASINKNGVMSREGNNQDSYISYNIKEGDEVCIVSSIDTVYLSSAKIVWEKQQSEFLETLYKALLLAVIVIALLIYLICVAGKKTNGEIKTFWIDRIWTEIHLAFLVGGVTLGTALWVVLVSDGYHFNERLWGILTVSIAVSTISLFLVSALSLIRKIKCGNFLKTSFIYLICASFIRYTSLFFRWIFSICKKIKATVAKTIFKKSSLIFITMLLIYTAAITACGAFYLITPLCILVSAVIFILGCLFLAYRASDIDTIKHGVKQVMSGELSYKISNIKCEDMKLLAEDINKISDGLETSVAEKLKAEKLKTELITNVSHDLKTPLTSIINYTELLSKFEGLSEEAKTYVDVIAMKSERLKNLTYDLFAISKAQSGNEEVIFEKIDLSLLTNQILGEQDDEIKNSGLTFCVKTDRELFIAADGKKLSRVINNLTENILKYAMKNTRVFISVFEKNGDIVAEFKNISSYPMDFDSDEIVSRFVRGDDSRSSEGNGLGLAIAKTYTELCQGNFEIIVDGDMFKAILTFKKYEDFI